MSRQGHSQRSTTLHRGKQLLILTLLLCLPALSAAVRAEADFTGVWVLLRHDRPGGMFGAPADPQLSAQGQAIVDSFKNSYTSEAPERGAFCVNSGMPESVFGIAGYPVDVVHTEERITLITEFQTEVRRIYLDGRSIPADQPLTRNGYSVGHWTKSGDRDVLVVNTARVNAWEVDKWVHSDQVSIEERLSLRPVSQIDAGPNSDLSADELVLENHITVTDPVMYDEPQSVTVWMRRVSDAELLEYTCAEYNWRNALEDYLAD